LFHFRSRNSTVKQLNTIGPENKIIGTICLNIMKNDSLFITKKGLSEMDGSEVVMEEFFDIFTADGEILGWRKAVNNPDYIIFNKRKYINANNEDSEDNPQITSTFTLCLFNIQTMTIEREYTGHIALSPSDSPFLIFPQFTFDDSFFFTGSEDGRIFIFQKDKSDPFYQWQAHSKLVNDISFHPSKKLMLTCSDDVTIKIWSPVHDSPYPWTF